jgi:23S rRNA G2069 N7-methylase RlmK/C1962 C5-methylase RlmI
MTRDREQVIPALKKYLDMNKLAMAAVKPGGILLTCSCTGLVDEASFLDSIRRAAFYANREVQVLEVRGAGPGSPVPGARAGVALSEGRVLPRDVGALSQAGHSAARAGASHP